MALPPSDTADEAFLREVDEGLRTERLMNIWRNYGRWIVGAIVAGLLAFAGYLYFQSRADRTAGNQGEKFDAAVKQLDAGQSKEGLAALRDLAANGNEGYAALARLIEAGELAEADDKKPAIAKYAAIVADQKLPQPFRDEALIRQTAAEFDQIKPDVVVTRLKAFAVPGSPWFGSAGEMVAMAYLKQGKRQEAGKLFDQLVKTKEFVPDTVRQRVADMAVSLGYDPADKSEEKKAQ